ncbi:hypothetical protein VSU19_00730 [Verrucomicrobiales bacterium BCK34]|nr:hypothetical protein [Verrucomicrobiales bacterium BCK34]
MKRLLLAITIISILPCCEDRDTDMVTLSFEINAPLGPMDCLEIFEDPLYEWLEANGGGPVGGGGGSLIGSSGIQTRDFFVDLETKDQVEGAIAFVEGLGVPTGSYYMIGDSDKVGFGDRYRFVLTVDETSLPDGDYFDLVTKIRAELGGESALLRTSSDGSVREFWVYTESEDQLTEALTTLKQSFPTLALQDAEPSG